MKESLISILKGPAPAIAVVVVALVTGAVATARHGNGDGDGDEKKFVVSSYIQTGTAKPSEAEQQTTVSTYSTDKIVTATVTAVGVPPETADSTTAESEPTAEGSEEVPVTTVPIEIPQVEVPMGTQAPIVTPPMMNGEAPQTETPDPQAEEQPENPVPNEQNFNYPHTDEDSATFYNSRITVAGDSIAYGFNVYGFIPNERNLASESVSMWNLNYFTFDGMGLVDAVINRNPSILYMSMGMNDVNTPTSADFASRYSSVLTQIHSALPDTIIVVAGITPVWSDIGFTTNATIRDYNSALQGAVNALGSDHIYYFDAYSVLCDGDLNLRDDCSGGDGIHLQTHCYSELFNALYNFLDTTPARALLTASGR